MFRLRASGSSPNARCLPCAGARGTQSQVGLDHPRRRPSLYSSPVSASLPASPTSLPLLPLPSYVSSVPDLCAACPPSRVPSLRRGTLPQSLQLRLLQTHSPASHPSCFGLLSHLHLHYRSRPRVRPRLRCTAFQCDPPARLIDPTLRHLLLPPSSPSQHPRSGSVRPAFQKNLNTCLALVNAWTCRTAIQSSINLHTLTCKINIGSCARHSDLITTHDIVFAPPLRSLSYT